MTANKSSSDKSKNQTDSQADGRRLVRLPKDGMIAGVAAGFADYFKVDISIMRIIFLVIGFATEGYAVLAYLILVIAMPKDDDRSVTVTPDTPKNSAEQNRQIKQYAGIAVVAVGVLMLVSQVTPEVWQIEWSLIWPFILILLGVWIITRSKK